VADFLIPYVDAIQLVQVTKHISRASAQKALDDAIAAGKLRTQSTSQGLVWANGKRIWQEGPSIGRDDLARWLEAKRSPGGKQARIIAALTKRCPDGVPDRAECPRERLKADLLALDRSIAPLNLKTLQKAIEAFNATGKR